MMRRTLKALNERIYAAERALASAVDERLPAGTLVHVKWGHAQVPAIVLRTSYARLEVRSIVSQKEYWVDVHRLVEFDRR